MAPFFALRFASLCRRLRHRGPDWSGYDIIEVSENRRHGIGHERLAIIDPESGAQPLESPDGQVTHTDDTTRHDNANDYVHVNRGQWSKLFVASFFPTW